MAVFIQFSVQKCSHTVEALYCGFVSWGWREAQWMLWAVFFKVICVISLDIGYGYILNVLNEKYSVPNCVKMHSVEQYFHLILQENISVCYCCFFFSPYSPVHESVLWFEAMQRLWIRQSSVLIPVVKSGSQPLKSLPRREKWGVVDKMWRVSEDLVSQSVL